MRRPWIAPGLFAEGPSDYHFLGELLPRVVREVAASVFGADFELRETIVPLDAPWERRRADRVAAALDAVADECTLLFIHTDGNGDPERARAERVIPALGGRPKPAIDGHLKTGH